MDLASLKAGTPTLRFHLVDLLVQHRRLDELVQEIVQSLRNPYAKYQTTCNSFSRLAEYTELHFADEEQFMTQNGYPEAKLMAHRNEHADFLGKLTLAHREFCNGQRPTPGDLSQYLRDWFRTHSIQEDEAYLGFFHARDKARSPEAQCLTEHSAATSSTLSHRSESVIWVGGQTPGLQATDRS